METFRCPTCIGVLTDPGARRCDACGQRMRRRRPTVLGEEARLGPKLPIDRWMLERLHTQAHRPGRHTLPPVVWHGKFSTSPLAAPDYAPTPSAVASPIDAPAEVSAPAPIEEPPTPKPATPATSPTIDDTTDMPLPPTVGALALDVYSTPRASPVDDVVQSPKLESVPQHADPVETLQTKDTVETVETVERQEPLSLIDLGTRPMLRRGVPHDELDPDVRAIVDGLYEQARAELSGNDLTLFAPTVEPLGTTAAVDETEEPAPPFTEPFTIADPIAPQASPGREPAPVTPIARPRGARRGWVPAFVADDRVGKPVSD